MYHSFESCTYVILGFGKKFGLKTVEFARAGNEASLPYLDTNQACLHQPYMSVACLHHVDTRAENLFILTPMMKA